MRTTFRPPFASPREGTTYRETVSVSESRACGWFSVLPFLELRVVGTGPLYPGFSVQVLPSQRRCGEAFGTAQKHMLPGIPRQESEDDAPSRAHDLCWNTHEGVE